MAEGKKARRKNKIVSRKRGTWISRPFGTFSDPFSSDSSDSDYIPDEVINPSAKLTGKRKKTERNSESSPKDENLKNKSKLENTSDHLKQTLDYRESEKAPLSSCSDWNNMPTELIVRIFNLLTQDSNGIQLILRSGMTCKQWHNGSKHPLLWEKVDLSFMSNSARANDKTIKALIRKQGENIRSLILTNWKKITKNGLMAISAMCPNLETLSISGCEHSTRHGRGIDAESIISIIDNCQLRNIDFSWFKLPSCNRIMHRLMELRGRELMSLNLSGCSVQSNTLTLIMNSCRNLQILDISHTLIYSINIEKLQASCSKLKELYIGQSNLTIKSASHCIKEGPCFPCLVALGLQCDCLTDEILARAVRKSARLKLLDLRTCRFITLQAIMDIEATMLERLFLSRACASFSLHKVLEKWGGSLYELDLSWISPGTSLHGLDNKSLGDIAATGIKYNVMKKLDLAGTAVQDEGIRYILEIFPNLEALNLISCKGVSRGLKHEHDAYGIEELRKRMKVSK